MNKGDRVKISAEGINAKIGGRAKDRTGTVIGFSLDKSCVRVRWDGMGKQGTSYDMSFIEHCPNE